MKKSNKLTRINILVTLLYLSISVLVVSFHIYQIKQYEMEKLTSGLIPDNSLSFTFNNIEQPIDWRDYNGGNSFTVISGEAKIRGFFYKNNTYIPPMTSGRFFQEQDFYNSNKLAVVGKKITKEEIQALKEDKFTIIGVLGGTYDSIIDELIFINIDALENGFPQENTYFLSPINSELNGNLSFNNYSFSIKPLQYNGNGVLRFLELHSYQLLVHVLFYTLITVFSFMVGVYWIKRKETEINILWQIGVTPIKPIKRYLIKLLTVCTSTFLLIGLLSLLYMSISQYNREGMLKLYLLGLLGGYSLMSFGTTIAAISSLYYFNQKK